MSIVLVGYRGSGKTTIGREVARILKWPFVDADEEIVKRAGKTIKDIFAQDGEPAFRELETHVVRDLMERQNTVISLGGGAIVREENRQSVIAAKATVVYLQADAQTLYDRIAADVKTAANRPALTGLTGLDEVRHLLQTRAPGYLAVMTQVLDVNNLSIEKAAERIAKMI